MTSYTVKLEELIAKYCDSDDMLNNVPMRALFEVASLAEQQSQQQSKAEKTDKKARKQKIKEEIVIPEAPDFWSGPYYDSWLQSNVKVDGKSVKQFKTFEEAIELANKIEDCRGVVLTESGKYALRRGRTGVLYGGNYVCLASWVKGTNNPEPEPKRQPEPEPEPEPEPPSDDEEEPEFEAESEDESDDDSLDVEEYEIDGVSYYIEQTQKSKPRVFLAETSEEVGWYKEDTNEIIYCKTE